MEAEVVLPNPLSWQEAAGASSCSPGAFAPGGWKHDPAVPQVPPSLGG